MSESRKLQKKNWWWGPNANRAYIIPNRYGFIAFGGVMILFFGGAWFSYALTYLLGTLLITIVLMAMVQSNTNVQGLALSWFRAKAVPVGEKTIAQFTIVNDANTDRLAIAYDFQLQTVGYRKASFPGSHAEGVKIHPLLKARSSATLEMEFEVSVRGIYPAPRVRLASVFPLGMFYAWQWQTLSGEFVVYPRPIMFGPLPRTENSELSDKTSSGGPQLGGERVDFYGLRPFRPGDALAAVDWKSRARGHPLMVKEFQGSDEPTHVLSWEAAGSVIENSGTATQGLSSVARNENKLSQLCAWILAMGTRKTFLLILPKTTLGPGFGQNFVDICLRELAAFEDV